MSFQDQWKNVKAIKIDNGTHIVKVNSVEFKPTKKDPEKQMFAWDLVLKDNKHFYHNRVISNETSMYYAKQDFLNLGLDEETVDDIYLLLSKLTKFIGCTIEIDVKETNGFQNATIKSLIAKFEDADAEEIPF